MLLNQIENKKIIKNKTSRWNLIERRREKHSTPVPILKTVVRLFNRRFKRSLRKSKRVRDTFANLQAFQLVNDNLVNSKLRIQKVLEKEELITPDVAITLLDEEINQTKKLLTIKEIKKSEKAFKLAIFTLQRLFIARGNIKNQFRVITPIEMNKFVHPPDIKTLSPKTENLLPKTKTMIVESSYLYQLKESLFPAEKMFVASGIRNEHQIKIGGMFNVTGKASAGAVEAEPNLLAQALIAMEESGSFFALWVHSHPGVGMGATHPSSIDFNQEKDWLKDYSSDLVNAIMVKDRYVRFWGKSISEKRIVVKVVGKGVKKVKENIYKLEI